MDLVLHFSPWLAVLLALACYALIPLIFSTRRRRLLPPGPKPLPLIGNILDLSGDQPHRSLARLAAIHGPLISLRLGAVTTVVATSPEMAREILHKHDASFSTRYFPDAFRSHAANSLVWAAPGQQWRGLRKISTAELFSTQRLDAHREFRQQKVQEMVAYVQKLSKRMEPVEIGRVAFTTSLNLLSRTIFSTDMMELEWSGTHGFKDILRMIVETVAAPNISDFFPALASLDLQGRRRFCDKLTAQLLAVFDELIEQRLRARAAGEPAKNDMIDLVLDLSHSQGGSSVRMDRATMKAWFGDLFTAGSETSSTTVEWAMTELLRNPESMAKARHELATAIAPGRPMDESDIAALPYLQSIVKETLRLHPPTPLLLPRRATQADHIGEYTIPEGSKIFVNIWAIGRSEAIWSEADKFIPERFLDGSVDYRGQHFELTPFGAGRRVCPGLPLATRMVHLMLGSLLQRFEWRLPANEAALDVKESFGLTLAKAVPLRALAVQRTWCGWLYMAQCQSISTLII